MSIISTGPIYEFSKKEKSFSDSSRSLGRDKLSWWQKSHHTHLSKVSRCNRSYDRWPTLHEFIAVHWEIHSGKYTAELILPVADKQVHSLKFFHYSWADVHTMQQLCYNSATTLQRQPHHAGSERELGKLHGTNSHRCESLAIQKRERQADHIYTKETQEELELHTHRSLGTEFPSARRHGRWLHCEGHGSSSAECPLVSGLTPGILNVTCFSRGGRKEPGLLNFLERAFCFHSMAQRRTDWWRL